ncbi:MAG: ATP phosphoribosyltransferase regulatory subunit [Candidatus Nanoarchaeia archaeon]|nr:ATP phosphoribosyltransferase regulatory subunit [Candidatus Nanoarchaeia archaeon]MDD5588289.1 ATP phosphoribosyltransferase regulatory subunit [Candidatus Nanoarchaeia archaeon]
METIKGFRDIIGIDALKRERIKEILIKNFKLYGFEPAETPIIEAEEFVKADNTSEVISDIYRLQDKGQRKLALRYELTFQLKRLAQNKKLPFKRYQLGEIFRDEPVSSNRFRQFTQCDVDIIGSNIKDEAEILSLTKKVFEDLKIDCVIYVNNRKLLNEILDKNDIKENKAEVIKEIDKLDKLDEKEIKENLKKYKAEKILDIFKKPESYFKTFDSYKEIEELKKYCEFYNVEVKFLPSLARGLSYYNGTIFEIKTKAMKETICAGGSYLINNIQSSGISFGLDRIGSIAQVDVDEKKVLIISLEQDKNSIELVKKLRKNFVSVDIMFGKVSKALEFANSYNIPYVVFIGSEEIKKKKYKLRDMKLGKETYLNEKDLIKKLL